MAPTLPAGHGHLSLSPIPHSHLTHLLSSYPLKLLSPRPLPSQPPHLRVCYILAYGGGLVGGDEISLRVEVGEASSLVLLTQGSTKVFRVRPGLRPLSLGIPSSDSKSTKQRTLINLAPASLLLLLPDPVSPFASSAYHQSLRIHLPSHSLPPANLLVLDWFTSGRLFGKQEQWAFDTYTSLNEILRDDQPLIRDRLVLTASSPSLFLTSELASSLLPYQIYATLIIHGPLLQPLLTHFHTLSRSISQRQLSTPPTLNWSYSPLTPSARERRAARARGGELSKDVEGGVVRVAGAEVEEVRTWVKEQMEKGGVAGLVGGPLWEKILG